MKSSEVIQSVEKLLNWAGEYNRQTFDYGTPDRLCMSEIHVIDSIGQAPGILQVQLCELLGLTKGRISVIVTRLEKKGLVTKLPASGNKKELPLQLSPMGLLAYQRHKEQDQKIFQQMESIISRYTEEEVTHFNQAILEILATLQHGS